MTEQEKTALTDEILTLQNEINEFGRKSVPLVIQCGKRLTEIQKGLPKGRWMDWQAEHSDVLSKSTINRYKRVYQLSLVTSLDGKTLTEVYEMMKSKKSKTPHTPGTNEPCTNEPEKSEDVTPLDVLGDLVNEVIETISLRISDSEKAEALALISAIVEYYNDQMELKVAA